MINTLSIRGITSELQSLRIIFTLHIHWTVQRITRALAGVLTKLHRLALREENETRDKPLPPKLSAFERRSECKHAQKLLVDVQFARSQHVEWKHVRRSECLSWWNKRLKNQKIRELSWFNKLRQKNLRNRRENGKVGLLKKSGMIA